ncbi:MAG: ferredoxin [Microthrixaceae bacterium]
MGYRVEVDRDLCQGHGVCESEAPEVFEVGPDRTVVVLTEHPGDDTRRAVELAVKYCPTHALRIVDEPAPEAGEGGQP